MMLHQHHRQQSAPLPSVDWHRCCAIDSLRQQGAPHPTAPPPCPCRSGVLDVAASVVSLLRRFFADHIDDLKPEQAFLEVGGRCVLG